MPNNPRIRLYFWGGYVGGGWLVNHNDCPFRFCVIFWFQPCNWYSLVGKNPNWLWRKKPLWHCLIGTLVSWITRIPTLLGRISSPIYPKEPVCFGSTEVTINLNESEEPFHHRWPHDHPIGPRIGSQDFPNAVLEDLELLFVGCFGKKCTEPWDTHPPKELNVLHHTWHSRWFQAGHLSFNIQVLGVETLNDAWNKFQGSSDPKWSVISLRWIPWSVNITNKNTSKKTFLWQAAVLMLSTILILYSDYTKMYCDLIGGPANNENNINHKPICNPT